LGLQAVTAAGNFVLFIALLGALYAVAASLAVRRFFRRPLQEASHFPPVTVLKPLHGAETGLADNLESFFRQQYPAPVQILCGVQASDDGAIPIVRALMAQYPGADAELVAAARGNGTNPKIANLTNMMPRVRHGVIVLSDSDIAVAPDYLRMIVGALSAPGVGALTCCYVGKPLGGLWARFAAQAIDYHFLPGVVLGTALGLATPCFGSTIALAREVLERIGGIEAFRDRLADDYEIGFAVRRLGLAVALPPFVVTHACNESSLAEVFRHELRWARTIRSVDPIGFAGSLVTHALPLGLIGAVLVGFSPVSLAVLAAILIARVLLKRTVDSALTRKPGGLWLFPLRDMLSFGVFVTAFFSAKVDWRGKGFRVHKDGALARD
jgi:ceramide glucosyltransferase